MAGPAEQRPLVLVAGATGYVGSRLVTELLDRRRYRVRALVRQAGRLPEAARDAGCHEVVGDVLQPETLKAACEGCRAVMSCVGGSLMGPGSVQDAFRPTGEGNLALFEAARAAGVSRFIMIASLNSEACRNEFEGFRVREAAIDCMKHLAEQDAPKPGGNDSGGSTTYTVFGPSGFFKDYDRIFRTVQRKRRASSLGDGFNRMSNPIHGADLAARMADSLERPEEGNRRIAVGGPEVFTFRQIVLLAADAAGVRNIRYKSVPVWGVRLMMAFLRLVSMAWPAALRYHAFAQFLLIISMRDSVGERSGSHRLGDHFRELAAASAGRGG